jgi:hypothetical protein
MIPACQPVLRLLSESGLTRPANINAFPLFPFLFDPKKSGFFNQASHSVFEEVVDASLRCGSGGG